jgi:Skp family chaperone for outer membrane proteins
VVDGACGGSYIHVRRSAAQVNAMKSSMLSVSMAIPVAVLLGFSLPRAPQGQDPANGPAQAPLAIGIVDMDPVAHAFPEFARGVEELKKSNAELLGKLNDLNKEAMALEASLETLEKDSLAFAERQHELRGKAAALESLEKMYNAYIEVQMLKLRHEMMRKVDELIERFAKKKKLDLVLRHRGLPDDKGRLSDIQSRMEVYMHRDVLWYGQALDVTNEVILFLKAELTNK